MSTNPAAHGAPQAPAGLKDWLSARAERRSERHPAHSAHYDSFPPRQVANREGWFADYLGNLWPPRFGMAPSPAQFETSIPAVDEEYFEYLDIFESVMDARGRYTMLEWGAGFARWSSLAVAAAREAGLSDIRIGCVEAEPRHLSMVIENLWLMGLGKDQFRVYPFALSGKRGRDVFEIGQATAMAAQGPWYGQALSGMNGWQPSTQTYFGLPELTLESGERAIEVMVEPASLVLADYDFVDIIDMDIQGAEADAVDEAIEDLTAKVRRLHIGTHSRDVEERLRRTLGDAGWLLLRDYPSHAASQTPYGEIHCVDGVQSWFNPVFPPPGFGKTN